MSVVNHLAARALNSRRIVRAPIWLYQHRLGWLLGHRVLMLEHTGRISGRTRFVCLEVVEHPSADTFVIVSGFGEHAQWYQNLTAHQACRLSTGRQRRQPAIARFMDSHESDSVLLAYQAAHPYSWKRLKGAIEQATGRPVGTLPMVELTRT
jgi:deazaflavin-dependent oxidoreductase (nitroreductase family)